MLPLLALLAALAAPAPARAASAADWRSRSVYQVMTDRFALPAGGSNTTVCNTSAQLYCGGTWSGITDHLDYIQGMGFTAVWISPIVGQLQVPLPPPADGTSYHGYWPQDLLSLNPAFGTADDLHALVSALHSRGMYIMLDVVVNHMVVYNTSYTLPNPSSDPLAGFSFSNYTPFNDVADYHPFCPITNYDNQTNVEQCWLGSSAVPLADLNTESDTVIDFYTNWIAETVANYSIDGLRIDTLKHVRQSFWPGFAKAAGVFTLGEVLDSDAQYVGDYTNYIDAVFDYPGWGNLLQAFQTQGGRMDLLAKSIQNTTTYYKNGAWSTASFLENHDQPRFPSLTSDQALIKNAITYTFVGDGIPIVYEGQEQGYTGGPVPANREAVWFSGYGQQTPLYEHISTLNRARQAAANASAAFHTTPAEVVSTALHAIALLKPPMLAVLTNMGENTTTSMVLPLGNSNSSDFGPGSELMEILSCTKSSVDDTGNLDVTFPFGAPQVFLPASIGSGLCASRLSDTKASSSSDAVPRLSRRPVLMGLAAVALSAGLAIAGLAFA